MSDAPIKTTASPHKVKLLVFTDLDGTLLDHHTYSYSAALPALEYLKQQGMPVVLNSSKTAAEMSAIHKNLELITPFVVENGSAIVYPDGNTHYFGEKYKDIRETLLTLRNSHQFNFTGFGDMTAQQVADCTGLPLQNAELAKQRSCTEPLQWNDDEDALEVFRAHLSEAGLKLLKGGRFYHVMGPVDKKDSIEWLLKKYQQECPNSAWVTIALGDGQNDKRMLEAVDYPVVIQPAKGNPLQLDTERPTITTTQQGPNGWLEAMQQLIQQLHNKEIHCG